MVDDPLSDWKKPRPRYSRQALDYTILGTDREPSIIRFIGRVHVGERFIGSCHTTHHHLNIACIFDDLSINDVRSGLIFLLTRFM